MSESDDPSREEATKSSEYHKYETEQLASINENLKSFRKEYEESNSQQKRQGGKQFRLEVAVAVGVGIYTIITALIFCIQRDQEHRQLRAYIIATKAEFERDEAKAIKLGNGANGMYPLLIDYELQNEGVTPAYAVEMLVDVEFPYAVGQTVKFEYTVGTAAYMPKQQKFGPVVTRHFSEEERRQIFSGDKPLLFAGQITYRDIFGYIWPTNFCFLHAKWPAEPRFGFCPRWNDADRLQYAK